jgi:hypothetical protein
VFVNVAGGLWLSLRAQLPFVAHLVGEQSVRPTLAAGVQLQVL